MDSEKIEVLNKLLAFLGSNHRAESILAVISGQRTVFVGSDQTSNEKIVVKLAQAKGSQVARIQREIRILREVNSEYFPQIFFECYVGTELLSNFYDSFDPKHEKAALEMIERQNFQPYLLTVENFIENVPWKSRANELRLEANLLDLLYEIFTALEILRNKSVVHRDLKPDNILLRPDGLPVIIDLGIAKSMRPETVKITGPFGEPCTPQFASPEQIANNKTDITYKSDQFSVGVIAYHLLTDRYPFGDLTEIAYEDFCENLAKNAPPKITILNPKIDEEVANLIHKFIEVHPYKRFRDPAEILNKISTVRRKFS